MFSILIKWIRSFSPRLILCTFYETLVCCFTSLYKLPLPCILLDLCLSIAFNCILGYTVNTVLLLFCFFLLSLISIGIEMCWCGAVFFFASSLVSVCVSISTISYALQSKQSVEGRSCTRSREESWSMPKGENNNNDRQCKTGFNNCSVCVHSMTECKRDGYKQ